MRKSGALVVLAGDYNVVPTDHDIYATRSYAALLHSNARKAYQRLLKQGWTDALRAAHPDQRIYTYLSYLRNRWPRDVGLRLDHLLLTEDVAERLGKVGVDRHMRGEQGASDHAPAWITPRWP